MIKFRFIFMIFVIFRLLTYQSAIAQTKVFIPDANFRNFLNNEYPTFMDITGDSLIADSAATLTGSLICDYQNIADLTGIEYFINITELSCTNNQLASLPNLSPNTALTRFICDNNQLISLPDLSANTALSWLFCSYNQLTSLPDLSANTALSWLFCSHNQLTSLPDLANNTVLSELYCFNNQLDSLPDLSANTALIQLECSSNQLTSLPDLSANKAFSELDCSNNQITSLPDLSANTALTLLICSGNQLTSIPDLSANTDLLWLICNSNQLTSIPDLSANKALTNLNCQFNQLTSLPDLSANTDLLWLACGYNQLTSLPDLSVNTNLAQLYCSYNKLDFSDAKELRIVDTIANLSTFTYYPQNPFGSGDNIHSCEGDTLVLNICSQDSAFSYQWFIDGNAIAGETDTLLMIPDVSEANSGIYTCRSYGTALQSPPMNWGPGISEFISEPFKVSLNTKATFTGLDTIYCLGASIDTLSGVPTGGTFNGPGIIDSFFIPCIAGEGTHIITYSYADSNNCASSDSQKVTVEYCTGLVSPDLIRNIKIYPNPSKGIFNISADITKIENIELRIINCLGQPVYIEELEQFKGSYTIKLDLRECPVGIYYLQILNEKGALNKQIIIE